MPLAFLLLLVIPASLFAVYVRSEFRQYAEQPPIQWKPFTYAAMEKLTAENQPVVMLGKPGYHASGDAAQKTFDDNRIRLAFHNGEFVAMLLEYDDWRGKEINNLFTKFGHTKHPIAMLFLPDGQNIKIDPFSANDILNNLPGRSNKHNLLLWLAFTSLALVCITGWKLSPNARNTR